MSWNWFIEIPTWDFSTLFTVVTIILEGPCNHNISSLTSLIGKDPHKSLWPWHVQGNCFKIADNARVIFLWQKWLGKFGRPVTLDIYIFIGQQHIRELVLLVNKGLKTQDCCQTWLLIAATKVCIHICNYFERNSTGVGIINQQL